MAGQGGRKKIHPLALVLVNKENREAKRAVM